MNKFKAFSAFFVISHVQETVKRFPFALLAALASGILMELFSRNHQTDQTDQNIALLCSLLSIPLLVGVRLIVEQLPSKLRLLELTILVVPLTYFFYVGRPVPTVDVFRFFLLSIAAHLLVSFAPFWKHPLERSFWEFNKTLFLNFLLSSLYSAIIYTGLVIILGALEGLFNLPVRGEHYRYIALILGFVFQPLHFLSRVPKNSLDEGERPYPNGLKILAQYVLLPLVSILGLVLIAYGAKILITMSWPRGLVAAFITTFSVVGVFTLLLIHPLTKETGSWFSRYSRIFYGTELILAILLLASIVRRIAEYGVTESRYIIVLEALWIFGISSYLLFSKKKNIISIPVSLFIIATLSSFGPWGLFAVSLRSQKSRFDALIAKYQLLENGMLKRPKKEIPLQDREELSRKAEYLFDHYGKNILSSSIKNADSKIAFQLTTGIELPEQPGGLTYHAFWVRDLENKQTSFDVSGYQHVVDFHISATDQTKKILSLTHDKVILARGGKTILAWGHEEFIRAAKLELRSYEKEIKIRINRPDFTGLIYVRNCYFNVESKNNSNLKITAMNGLIFM